MGTSHLKKNSSNKKFIGTTHTKYWMVGVPIILLRNLNSPRLYRLRVTSLPKYLIEAEILTGCAKGEKIFLPKTPL
ncbi:ATP-dependent DNA helicase [Aphis craccivora]|uniref:ATP-dependent DNA helicase n=1 Tax=Aphis craccivora TaxID=307492 RepID=A0A6G0YAW4_APHCR|nr:ATP-dependent DNA helicase [Aphis craccivora]